MPNVSARPKETTPTKSVAAPPEPVEMPTELPSVDPESAAKLRTALKSVRTALAERNLTKASEQLAVAQPLAGNREQKQEVELHQTLMRHSGEFWKAVQAGAAKLNGGDELDLNGKPLGIVVESSADKLAIKLGGKTQIFAIPSEITADVAIAIVQRTIVDPAEQNLLLGAFYAADVAGDLPKAESLWQSSGEKLQPLLMLLKGQQQSREAN
jgi:hypothetical protein